MRKLIDDIVGLFFPDCCLGCDRPLVKGEELICVYCRFGIPKTAFHLQSFHEGVQLVGGHFPLEFVLAYLYFDGESRVQQMIHRLKYFRQPALAYQLGVEYGKILVECNHPVTAVDALIPVPMTSAKQRKRGYNQSEVFAQGLSSVLAIPVLNKVLRRKENSQSQVGKGRRARFQNLAAAIELGDPGELAGKHVLLVDDVLTSGATVVACAKPLVIAAVDRISVVAIARKR